MVRTKRVDILDRLKEIRDLQKEFKITRGILKISKTKNVSKLIVGKRLARKGFISKATGKITPQGRVALKRLDALIF